MNSRSAPKQASALKGPYLEVEPPDGTSRRIFELPLEPDAVVSIGRDSDEDDVHNDLAVEGTAVGRRQCQLVRQGSQWHIQRNPLDKNQTNPMFLRYNLAKADDNTGTVAVSGQQSYALSDGDIVYFFADARNSRWLLHYRSDPRRTEFVRNYPRLEVASVTSPGGDEPGGRAVWLKSSGERRYVQLRDQLQGLLFVMDELNHANGDHPAACPHAYLIAKLWGDKDFTEQNTRGLVREIRSEIDRVIGIKGAGEKYFLKTIKKALLSGLSVQAKALIQTTLKGVEPPFDVDEPIFGYRLVKEPGIELVWNDKGKVVALEPAESDPD